LFQKIHFPKAARQKTPALNFSADKGKESKLRRSFFVQNQTRLVFAHFKPFTGHLQIYGSIEWGCLRERGDISMSLIALEFWSGHKWRLGTVGMEIGS
jgi:hypothetical protein